jgi:HAD superfamily hydrolase (TIGR01509 family)
MDTPAVDWTKIDTVLLDMDGTLLDLRFDNWFWQELVPGLYAAAHDLSLAEAIDRLGPKFRGSRGTIQWYCIDHWSRELGLDIAALKRTTFDHMGYLPGAEDFLVRLGAAGKRRVLVTNAHPLTLAVKTERVGLGVHFDAVYSSHAFGAPKESADFWPRLQAAEPFALGRTLFVDDSLPVLHAAEAFGVGWLRAVRRPDTGQPPQATAPFPGVDRIADLLG